MNNLVDIFEFSEKDKEDKVNKTKVAGHVAAAAGLATMPAAIPFLRIKGRQYKKIYDAWKVKRKAYKATPKDMPKGERSKIASKQVLKSGVLKETDKEKGKFVSDYMRGGEASNRFPTKQGSKIVEKVLDPKGKDKFSKAHMRSFRQGKQDAHDFWDYEVGQPLKNRAMRKGEIAGKAERDAKIAKNPNLKDDYPGGKHEGWYDDLKKRGKVDTSKGSADDIAVQARKKHKVAQRNDENFDKGKEAFRSRMDRLKGSEPDYYKRVEKASAQNLTKEESAYLSKIRKDKQKPAENKYGRIAMLSPALAVGGGVTAGREYYKEYKNRNGKKGRKK